MFRAIAVAIAIEWLSLITGCASGIPSGSGAMQREPPRILSLRGTLIYPARIALPPESIAVVELRDVSSSNHPVITEQRIALGGRQVPIQFELTVNRSALATSRQYNVRGGVFLSGKPTWATEPVLIDPASEAIDLGTLIMMPVEAWAIIAALRCCNQNVTIGYTADTMHLALRKETNEMRPVEVASEATFAATC